MKYRIGMKVYIVALDASSRSLVLYCGIMLGVYDSDGRSTLRGSFISTGFGTVIIAILIQDVETSTVVDS